MKRLMFIGLISFICYCLSAQMGIVIDARCNIYGAGLPSPPAPGGGDAGLLPVAIDLTPGTKLMAFGSIRGEVSCCNGDPGTFHGADGSPDGSTTLNPVGGISGIIHDYSAMFLCGVFLGPVSPSSAPTSEVFSDNTDFTSIGPEIGQVFFIGDGLTGTGDGVLQKFMVPTGATRLFLGFADALSGGQETGHYGDNTGQLNLNAFGIPEFDLKLQIDTCTGTGQIAIESANINGTERSFGWSLNEELLPDELDATLEIQTSGEYRAMVIYDLGISSGSISCDSTVSVEIPEALPSFSLEIQPADCGQDNGSVEISFHQLPAGLTTSIDNGPPNDVKFNYGNLAAGPHLLTITLDDQCSSDTTFVISEQECPVYIPNIFSPNDDGVNDKLTIGAPANSVDMAESFEIYNRWGGLVFAEYNTPLTDIAWDGTSNGNKVSAGTYFYILKVRSSNGSVYTRTGDVSVVR